MYIMHTIERRLFFFYCLLAVVQVGSTGTVPESFKTSSVSKLMLLSTSDKLVNYFKELQLDKYCDSQLLNEESFKAYETNNPVPCLCTVIYHMTKELDSRNLSQSSVEAAKIKTNDNDTFNDPSVYETWKNVSKMSPFLKFLMEPLKDNTQFNKICSYGLNNAVSSYCKFLNVEVLLLHSFLPKPEESAKVVSVNLPEKIKKQIHSVLTEESKKSKTQLETDNDFPGDEFDTDDVQKLNDENNNNFTTEDEMDQQTELKDVDAPAKTKIDLQSSNDYPKEDDGTLHTENKEIGVVYSRKNAFTNRGFGDTEDSHFLFYFGIMTVLSMTFYLALYNKKKIIALLIEGRRSTNHRRRPNTASYSKVETDDGSTVF